METLDQIMTRLSKSLGFNAYEEYEKNDKPVFCAYCKLEIQPIRLNGLLRKVTNKICDKCENARLNYEYWQKIKKNRNDFFAKNYPNMEADKFLTRGKPELEHVKNVAKNFCGASDLIFLGERGLGKTHLAIVALRAYLELKPRASFEVVNFVNLTKLVKAKDYRGGDYLSLINRLTSLEILVVDDIGADRVDSFTNRATTENNDLAYLISNERDIKKLCTIYTTNLSLNEMADKYDKNVASRVYGNAKVLKLKGKDHRLETTVKLNK